MTSFRLILVGILASVFFAFVPRAVLAHTVDVDVKCWGEHHDAKVVVTWGFPKHDEHSQTIEVHHGDSAHQVLDIPDHSEMDIRTEGGRDTKYEIKAHVHDRGDFVIAFDHGEQKFDSHGAVDIEHKEGPNERGEGQVRVHVK